MNLNIFGVFDEEVKEEDKQSKAVAYTKIVGLGGVFGGCAGLIAAFAISITPLFMFGHIAQTAVSAKEANKAGLSLGQCVGTMLISTSASMLLAWNLATTPAEKVDVRKVEDKPAITAQVQQQNAHKVKLV